MNKLEHIAEALRTMPQMQKAQWDKLSLILRWLIATRAAVLIMTFSSAAIGILLAWPTEGFQLGFALLVMLGLLFAHATNNLLNDLTDSKRGIDKDNYFRNQYGIHVLESGFMSLPTFYAYLLFTAVIALLAGFLLVYLRGGLTFWLMAAGAFFVIFYTWPLKYIGLGEPSVLLVWGPLMVGGSYYVCAGDWSWSVTLIGLCYALGPTAVLFGKHIDKLDADKAKGVHSLPVILGHERACRWAIGLLISQYILAIALVVSGIATLWLLLIGLNLVVTLRAIKAFRQQPPENMPEDFPREIWPLWYAPHAFDHTRQISAWFLLALLLGLFL